jgi:8-oxo-dGTP diphosphatase
MLLRRFNVRVYGILINEQDQVLVSDEQIKGIRTTKFPGGGLELGEGLRDALVREFKEECKVDIAVTEHLYTTDFFVASQFDSESQVISVYYLCVCPTWQSIQTSLKPFDYTPVAGVDTESFRWVRLSDIERETEVNLPIDRVVVKILADKYPKVGFRIPGQ